MLHGRSAEWQEEREKQRARKKEKEGKQTREAGHNRGGDQ